MTMKNFSRPILLLPVVLIGLAPATSWAAAGRADIPTVESRRAVVQTANRLSRPGALPEISANLVSPFNPSAVGVAAAPTTATSGQTTAVVAPVRLSSARDVLNLVAPYIKPTGTMSRGDEVLLMLGSKPLKVGDTVSVTVEGRPYQLEISGIQNNAFTLRYQGEETTRPITAN